MVTLQKILTRITETRWSKLYVTMAFIQCVFIIALQASICIQNTAQANLLPQPIIQTSNVLISTINNDDLTQQAAHRLGRIKWENIAFIGFQGWFFGMAVDATIYQNTAEILVLAVLNCLCAIMGALQVIDCRKWLKLLSDTPHSTAPLLIAEKLEITLSVFILAFASAMCYLSFQMSKQFGWNIYKKIGADVRIQKMYKIFQFFVLALKIDIYTEFVVSLFYLIQFNIFKESRWDTWIQIVVAVAMLPMLYFARTAGSTESIGRMVTFITFQGIVIVHFALILKQTLDPNNNWYTWICFVSFGMAICITTMVLGSLCMKNFDQGLQPYVQRGSADKKKLNDLELNKTNTNETWKIDDN
ncbi:hypothetical protein BDB01DRAFT_773303 [Pilobolus umbonatus]|nr:hypothetical protein BDB01DRAFT_773303 [Pilobolus umbonatus]